MWTEATTIGDLLLRHAAADVGSKVQKGRLRGRGAELSTVSGAHA